MTRSFYFEGSKERSLRKGDTMLRRTQTKRLFTAVLALLFLLIPAAAHADGHMNSSCTIEIHARDVNMKNLTDYTYSTVVHFETNDWFSVRWTEEKPVAAVYWEWLSIPARAKVEMFDDAGEVVFSREYANKIRFLTVFPQEGVREVRMTVLEGKGDMAELFTYSQRQVPSKAVAWEEPLDKADILLVETHGNDDALLFGAVIPTYTDRGYKIQVADIACDTIGRQRESSGGSYHLGLRNFKTFFQFTGYHTAKYQTFADDWLSKSPDPYQRLTAEIRRVRPEVVITHDIENGDNGDGSHKLTAEIVRKCVEAAADPSQYPKSAEQYGVWQVKKLYFHNYSENRITIDIDTPLASFDGKTAYQLAVEGITLWHGGDDPISISRVKNRSYAPSDYGLAFSTVGEDVQKNDFLEHIPPEALSNYIPPTPEPTQAPTPEPTPAPTVEPTAAPILEVEVTEAPSAVPAPSEAPAEAVNPDGTAEQDRFPTLLLILIAASAVLLIGCTVFWILVRKRQRRG